MANSNFTQPGRRVRIAPPNPAKITISPQIEVLVAYVAGRPGGTSIDDKPRPTWAWALENGDRPAPLITCKLGGCREDAAGPFDALVDCLEFLKSIPVSAQTEILIECPAHVAQPILAPWVGEVDQLPAAAVTALGLIAELERQHPVVMVAPLADQLNKARSLLAN